MKKIESETIDILQDAVYDMEAIENDEDYICEGIGPDVQNWYHLKEIAEILVTSQHATLLALADIVKFLKYITDLTERDRPLTEESKTEQV